jgi:mRNA interferase RelE/StbE
VYNYKLSKQVQKFLFKKDKNFVVSFYNNVDIISINPFNNNLDIKKLNWKINHYRLRIWKYRFLYEIINKDIIIYFYEANSRWDIY